jgi:transglutaminase-like putative cysteine protease
MPKQKKSFIRWLDWQAALLGLVLVQIAAGRLVATQWTEHLTLVQVVGFFGILLGLALGQSIFSRTMAGLFAIAYGVLVIPWQIGSTLVPGIGMVERLLSLRGRLGLVLQELIQRDAITDNILFLLLMALVFWIVAVYAGFTLVRYAHAWRVVLPIGLTIFVIHSFDPLLSSRSWYLAFYLFFALLLVARLVFLNNRAIWKQHHTHIPPDIGFDLARFTALVALVLVLFAWNVPVMAETLRPVANVWRTATHPWMNLRDRFSFAFASLRASVGLVSDMYGESLSLGLGSPLSDQILMEVEAPSNPPQGVRYYWRARVYSVFDGSEWEVGVEDTREFLPGGRDLTQPGVDSRVEAVFTFHPYNAITTLYVVPQPLWVSRPSEAVITTNPDGTIDLESFRAQEYLRPGEQYDVRSSVSAVTIKDLRAAGTDYPQWVLERYLQLPEDVTPRTYELAQRLAQGQETPYDVTAVVTSYLRENITYQLTIDAPPTGVNRLDWFLFEYKKGFCNYYATSEVILLRSLGIPARIAVGFAQGERQVEIMEGQQTEPGEVIGPDIRISDIVTYLVRQKYAHAWPEVFFPGIGWVEFEPTSNEDPLFRPSGEDLSTANEGQLDSGDEPGLDESLLGLEDQERDNSPQLQDGSQSEFWTAGNIVRLAVLLLAVAVLVWVVSKTRKGDWAAEWFEQLSRQSAIRIEQSLSRLGLRTPTYLRNWVFITGLPPLGRAYLEINRSLKRLGKETKIQETPAERANALIEILPAAKAPNQKLLNEYQAGLYSQHEADPEAARQASIDIRKYSYLEIVKRFLARFQEPERRQLRQE